MVIALMEGLTCSFCSSVREDKDLGVVLITVAPFLVRVLRS